MGRWKWLMLGVALMAVLVGGAFSRAAPDPSVEAFLKEMYGKRARALLTGQAVEGLERFYDSTGQGGRFALAHEEGRIAYMQAWAPARGLKITEAETLVTNLRVKRSGSTATVSLIARTRLGYKYGGSDPLNEMGIGSWHWLQLVQEGEQWKVQREFFLDALGSEWTKPYVPEGAGAASEAMAVLAGAAEAGAEEAGEQVAGGGRLDREGAKAYAEKYCGAAWGCGNNSDYNERYRSYRNLGGDCANFASQTLVVGGKVKPDWSWRTGSACWLNAQAFTRHMIYSGRAALLAKGTYPKVAPVLGKLQPGDIVAYQLKGTITHVSVVTGKDSVGVPLVTAHTADRFRNPWDLGWDKETIFWILHMRE